VTACVSEVYFTTPSLSLFTRRHVADSGIMVTASHNPPASSGIKVSASDGPPITGVPPAAASRTISASADCTAVGAPESGSDHPDALADSRVEHIHYEHYEKYQQKVKDLSGDIPPSDLQGVFSSLHGTALPLTQSLLEELGFNNMTLVDKECEADSDFTHVTSANPEDTDAFTGARALGRDKNADLLIATDPDADRIGIEVLHDGEYAHLNGNQLGVIL